jgi:hypothetical protein
MKSLHITIQNIRIIHDPPTFSNKDIQKVIELKDYIKSFSGLKVELGGLVNLPNCIAIKGYPDSATSDLILGLRERLKQIGLPDDKTYKNPRVPICNLNIRRYIDRPNQIFYKLYDSLKDKRIGTLNIDKIALISTNYVSAPRLTKVHHIFHL